MKRIALYARVSLALKQTPENQIIALEEWATKVRDIEIDRSGNGKNGVFVDQTSSRDLRPNKEAILKKLRTHQLEGVVFWSLDRWGRSLTELVLELDEFSKMDYLMISLKEGIDLTTAAGRLYANMIAMFAGYERDRIRERTILGLARARAQGKHIGRPQKVSIADLIADRREGLSYEKIGQRRGISGPGVCKRLKDIDINLPSPVNPSQESEKNKLTKNGGD